MEFQNGNNKFFSYLLLLVAFFILLFVTRGFFYTLQEKLDDVSTSQATLDNAQKELAKLNDLDQNLRSNNDDIFQDISKFTLDFNSENLFNYIYSYVDTVNGSVRDTISMRSLEFSPGTLGDFGLYEGTVSITANFSSQRSLLSLLNYLISQDSQYTFFITNFSYPDFGKDGSFQATIPLKMYYKK